MLPIWIKSAKWYYIPRETQRNQFHSYLRIFVISFNLRHKNLHVATNNLVYEWRAEFRDLKPVHVTLGYWDFRRVRHCVPRAALHVYGDPRLTVTWRVACRRSVNRARRRWMISIRWKIGPPRRWKWDISIANESRYNTYSTLESHQFHISLFPLDHWYRLIILRVSVIKEMLSLEERKIIDPSGDPFSSDLSNLHAFSSSLPLLSSVWFAWFDLWPIDGHYPRICPTPAALEKFR